MGAASEPGAKPEAVPLEKRLEMHRARQPRLSEEEVRRNQRHDREVEHKQTVL